MFLIVSIYVLKFNKVLFIEWRFFNFLGFHFYISIFFDYLRVLFLVVVSLISGSIIMYRSYYIRHEKNYVRFIYIVVIFIFSMFFLIFSGNFIRLLLGWDGLGLSSYCLVIFYQNYKSNNRGIVTVITNRLGDVGILSLIGILFVFNEWSLIYRIKIDWFCLFLLIFSSFTKRAQIPFSAWLPAAMAAPTPVSALVHSSTLVTAGIYLLIRSFEFIDVNTLSIIFFFGVITSFISGCSAVFEYDLKKIVALSTLSQLGFMIIILGCGFIELVFFHLVLHAFFKSLLFISVGYLIHRNNNNQDSRNISNFYFFSPFIRLILVVRNLSLMGFPFIAGFYSKDVILERFLFLNMNYIYTVICFLRGSLTICYRVRFLYLIIRFRINNHVVLSKILIFSYIYKIFFILFLIRIFRGFYILFFLEWGLHINIIIGFEKYYIILFCLIIGLYIFFNLSRQNSFILKFINNYLKGFILIIYINFISTKNVSNFFLINSFNRFLRFDKGWGEFYGGNGLYIFFIKFNWFLQKNQFLKFINYQILIGIILLFVLFFFY